MDRTWPYPPAYLEAVYLVLVSQKEKRAVDVIRRFNTKNTAVAVSGKDSIVALHLTTRAGVYADVVIGTYVAARRLPQELIDELVSIAKSFGVRIIIHDQPWNAHASLFRIISKTYGYDAVITGIRRRENRGHSGIVEYYNWGLLINSIINWTVAEVWSYIYHYRLRVPLQYRFVIRPETPLQHLVE
jgi:3'-phosphoadenosine 5'-phosphosulfate sulfotransferase (PAPS reductase)/FAD synthetase